MRKSASILFCALVFVFRSASAAEPANLQRDIEAAVKNSRFTAGVAIKDLASGEEFLIDPDGVYPQGSCIRIHLVAELFRQAAAGKLSLKEPRKLPEYDVLMIGANDHTAANFLTDIVGMENVNASLAAQGTPEIKFRRRAISRRDAPGGLENEGTPRSVMRALELLHAGKVVDRATSDAIIEVLAVPEMAYFRRELPPRTLFAGRSGSGPEMRCVVGLVLLGTRPV